MECGKLLIKALKLPRATKCCKACHEDESFIEIMVYGMVVEVCCTVLAAIDRRGIRYQWQDLDGKWTDS